jgi:hypothetical protein
MPNGADMLYHDINKYTKKAQTAEANGSMKLAKLYWERAAEIWSQVLDHHAPDTGVSREAIKAIYDIRAHIEGMP